MSTLLLPIPRFAGRGFPLDWASRILVAADGRDSSDAALAMAWTLGGHSMLDVISVVVAKARGTVSEEARAERVRMVEAQLVRALGVVPDGDVIIEHGSPPDIIANSARLRGATLLVTGLGTLPVRDRLLGDEHTLAIARRTFTPLFAVAPGRTSRPRRILVAIDYSHASYAACDAALAIAGQDALIVLAHVQDVTTRSTPSGALTRLADRVRTGFGGRVAEVEREGDPAGQLLDIARGIGADTIAIGGHGQTAALESALGPVATRVMRCSSASVLLVPAFDEC